MSDKTIETIAVQMTVLHEDVGEMKMVLRDLTSAITKLAVVEERQLQTTKCIERIYKALDETNERLSALEQQAPLNMQANSWAERLMVGAVTVLLVFATYKIGLLT